MSKRRKVAPSEAPDWYVPGLCRGAVGFITRSDLGPMKVAAMENSFGSAPAGYVGGSGRGAIPFNREELMHGEVDRGDYSETVYDKWNGYQGSLFANVRKARHDV